MKSTKILKVIIAGAGPAGIAAAIRCAQLGIKATMFEKEIVTGEKPCGGAVSPRAVHLYSRLGLTTDYFNRTGRPESEGHIEGFGQTLHGHSHGKQPGYMIERKILDRDFQNLACEKYGIPIERGARVTGVRVERETVFVSVKRENAVEEMRADILIAADGAASIIRGRLFGARIRDNDIILTAGAVLEEYEKADSYIRFHEKYLPTYSWLFPYRNNKTNVGIGMYRSVFRRNNCSIRIFDELIGMMDPRLLATPKRRWFINTNPFQKKNYQSRVFLIGDAGGYVNPLTGEGIYYALQSGMEITNTIKHMNRFGSLAYVYYLVVMFPSFLKLAFSKICQLCFFYVQNSAALAFAITSKSKIINRIVFRYFSNT